MEFLELMEDILSYLPPESAGFVSTVNSIFPFIVIGISVLVCFFGYKIHHIWASFVFSLIGFLLGAIIGTILPALDSRLVLLLSVLLAVLGIVFSHKLLKMQIFLLNFILVFAALPNFITNLLPDGAAVPVSLAVAIAVGICAVKFKFIVTIFTTAYAGAVTAVPVILQLIGQEKFAAQTIVTISLFALGSAFQFFVEAKAIKKEKAEKTEKALKAEATKKARQESELAKESVELNNP